MTENIEVLSRTQKIVPELNTTKPIEVLSRTQRIVVDEIKGVTVINAGPPGPGGLRGQQGDPGQDGEQGEPGLTLPNSYHHVQNDLSSDWPVEHNLGYKPALAACEDDAGTKFRPGIEHIDNDNLIAHFIGPCRGTADFA